MPSSSGRELQGPKPPPPKVGKDSWRMKEPAASRREHERRVPVVVYLPAHTKGHPHQFMNLVQRLTGKPSSSGSSRCSTTGSDSLRDLKQGDGTGEDGDTLLLTLGHFSSTPSVPSPVCVSKSVL
ncbi:hypothetical protein BHE74_00026448 [Ensete ventricosum]|nr:hypothetical protein BHE74_00026448 [Ensete ventricosum]